MSEFSTQEMDPHPASSEQLHTVARPLCTNARIADQGVGWYAAYTKANHEKRVAEQLCCRQIECFLPLYESFSHRKDRQVSLRKPLFPGYVFVRIDLRNRLPVLQVAGVARLVGFSGDPAVVPTTDIEALRSGLAGGLLVRPHPYLTVGRRVRIRFGPLAGVEGILRRWKGNWRVVLSVRLIQQSISTEVDAACLDVTSC